MDLDARTLDVLDWHVVRDALAEHAVTDRGVRVCRDLQPLPDRAAVRDALDGVDEVLRVREEGRDVPLGDIGDVEESARRASKGESLELSDLRRVGVTLEGLQRLSTTVLNWELDLPVLQGQAGRIALDPGLVDTLHDAFDEQGRLSARLWPELGELRTRIADLHTAIRRTLDELLQSDALADLLQDAYVTQRRDRYVLPIKSRAKHWDLGIVHDTSGSGQTVYIEPTQVVQLNNQLRVAEGELEAAEARIRAQLSRWIGAEAEGIAEALDAATVVDSLAARAGLAERLDASRPRVGSEGVVKLKQARHPVLALRGVTVVPNDLGLDGVQPALVLSGPNAGGKTVALKTLGLCALLVRCGCHVPAEEGSRVDWFDAVYADIGDAQSIQGDLSSFSGHLLVLREMLGRAAPGTLVLLDEVATGTDPTQGAALARAVLESLVERGARAVVTTHYAQLKGLATADPRFAVAAMEYAGDRPTYRVVPGVTGESHAFAIAARLGLEDTVLARARALMGDAERAFTEALEALEQQRQQAAEQGRLAREEAERLAARSEALTRREAVLQAKAEELKEQAAADFVGRLRRADKAIAEVVAGLQRAPSHEAARRARASVDALRGLVPTAPAAEPAVPLLDLVVGDRVRLRKLGQEGEVVAVGSGEVQVRAGGLTVRARPEDLEPARDRPARRAAPPPQVRLAPTPKTDLSEAVRYPGNTCDLRGMRVDEALAAAEQFMDAAVRDRTSVVFFLHGHGTGALKQAIREWLPSSAYVAASQPASADQGGDAFTIATLR